jgi:hypothetical protein
MLIVVIEIAVSTRHVALCTVQKVSNFVAVVVAAAAALMSWQLMMTIMMLKMMDVAIVKTLVAI